MLSVFSIIVLCVALHWISEVIVGGSAWIYDSEVGLEVRGDFPARISSFEFFTRVAPLTAVSIGLPMCITLP